MIGKKEKKNDEREKNQKKEKERKSNQSKKYGKAAYLQPELSEGLQSFL